MCYIDLELIDWHGKELYRNIYFTLTNSINKYNRVNRSKKETQNMAKDYHKVLYWYMLFVITSPRVLLHMEAA